MFQVGVDWNPRQARLKELLMKQDAFQETKALLLEMHSFVHSKCVYGLKKDTYMDEIQNGLSRFSFITMPTVKDVTIAWNIWHITRIEDLVANMLIADNDQVLNQQWLEKLNTNITDTANAMTDEEIIAFSESVNQEQLFNYRNAVGSKTKEIIGNLTFQDLKHKVAEQTNRIYNEGGIINHPDSIWLLDFWGKKTVAGLLTMPITRHQIVHLNDCIKLKEKCRKLEMKKL